MSTTNVHLLRAIELLNDTQGDFAEKLGGLSQSTVSSYVTGRRTLPPKHCRKIEALTAGQVTRYQLRPDIFGEQPEVNQAA